VFVAHAEQAVKTIEELVVAEGFAEEIVDAIHGGAQFLDDAGGESEDAHFGTACHGADTAGSLGTVHEGHAEVHEDGVGAE
jgi:hypothetical protein